MENKTDVEQGFYNRCAELLGCAEHTYKKFPYTKRTRWNNRTPGNGRYPGFGIIRMFGTNCVHVSLTAPVKVNRTFSSTDAVLTFLESLGVSHPT